MPIRCLFVGLSGSEHGLLRQAFGIFIERPEYADLEASDAFAEICLLIRLWLVRGSRVQRTVTGAAIHCLKASIQFDFIRSDYQKAKLDTIFWKL